MNTAKDSSDLTDSTNVVVPAEKKQTIILGKKEFPVNKEGCVDLTDIRIPNIQISELPEDIVYEWMKNFFFIRFDPRDKEIINFSANAEIRSDPSTVSYRALSHLYLYSMRAAKKRYPSIRDIYSTPSDYTLFAGFSVRIDAKTLSELVKLAENLATEVSAPVIEAQNLVYTFIQDLKKKTKK